VSFVYTKCICIAKTFTDQAIVLVSSPLQTFTDQAIVLVGSPLQTFTDQAIVLIGSPLQTFTEPQCPTIEKNTNIGHIDK
jgi:hypothetical protein